MDSVTHWGHLPVTFHLWYFAIAEAPDTIVCLSKGHFQSPFLATWKPVLFKYSPLCASRKLGLSPDLEDDFSQSWKFHDVFQWLVYENSSNSTLANETWRKYPGSLLKMFCSSLKRNLRQRMWVKLWCLELGQPNCDQEVTSLRRKASAVGVAEEEGRKNWTPARALTLDFLFYIRK